MANSPVFRSVGRLLLLSGSCLLASSCRPPVDAYSRVHSDSGIYGPQYEQIVANMETVAGGSNGFATVINYGSTLEGRTMAMIKLGSPTSSAAKRPAVVITGAIHGDEFLDVAHKLPEHFLSQRDSGPVSDFFKAGGIIYVAPILNPDGYDARQRGNQRGTDLNRDFPLQKQNHQGLSNPETIGLAKALREEVDNKNVKLVFTLDYHCCQGSLIYPWGYSQSARLPSAEETEYKRFATLMLQEFQGYKSGRVFDLLQYTALGGSTDYYHESFGARAFTFEGAYKREAQQFDRHTRMWNNILVEINKDADVPTTPTGTLTESRDIFLDLSKASGQSREVAIASPAAAATRMVMCEGDGQACANATATKVLDFANGTTKNGIAIFRAQLAQTLKENTVYSFVAFGSDNKPSLFRSFKLERP